jgi:hypothetical protein
VGALGHYLENAGVPTTQISLIREHTEIIRPPRALWVPFELGRPLGVAGDRSFQNRVLLTTLHLLEAQQGPLLVDFLEEAYADRIQGETQPAAWACPVNFGRKKQEEPDLERRLSSFLDEVRQLKPWYELRMERINRTAMVSFTPDAAARLLADLARGKLPDHQLADVPLAAAIRIAAQDLKAFYFEATTAKPGAKVPSSETFSRWFWQETAAGCTLVTVKQWCLDQNDKALRMTGAMLLVPLDQS